MLEVNDALRMVLELAPAPRREIAPLTSSSLGQVVAQPVVAPMDSPPFDKAMMDGFAIRTADGATLPVTLALIDEIAAGDSRDISTVIVGPGQTIRVMTGAPIPSGCDAVVMHEKTRIDGTAIAILPQPLSAGLNVLRRGREMATGDTVLDAGCVLGPQEFGILAGLGRTTVSVYARVRVTILSTGNELVEPMMKPGPGQIRNSNGTMLMAQSVRAGALPRYLGIARDTEAMLTSMIREGLVNTDILLLSGGVSAGNYDLVPDVLGKLGVVPRFHKVRMKPGKPLYFGTIGSVLVFGLPGNPGASYNGFELFVRPAIRKMAGMARYESPVIDMPLTAPLEVTSDRPLWLPVRVNYENGGMSAGPVSWLGSADLRAMSGAGGLMVIPEGTHRYETGHRLPVVLLEQG